MTMDRKMMYAFRGWIAFVAFMDLGTAVKSYIEKRSFLTRTVTVSTEFNDEEYTVSRLLGIYSVLKAVALVHCTLYIHYKPYDDVFLNFRVVSMGICSLIISIVLYFTETIYFRAATLNFYVVFPCILNVITLGGLVYLPNYYNIWDSSLNHDEENVQLLKQAGAVKRRRNLKKTS